MAAAGASYADDPATLEDSYGEDDQPMSPSSAVSSSEEKEEEMTDEVMVETVASIFKHISTWQGLSESATSKLSTLSGIWSELRAALISAGPTAQKKPAVLPDPFIKERSAAVDKGLARILPTRSKRSRKVYQPTYGSRSTLTRSGTATTSVPMPRHARLHGPPILRRVSAGATVLLGQGKPGGLMKPRRSFPEESTGSPRARSGSTATASRKQ